jgi:hypothetical protein
VGHLCRSLWAPELPVRFCSFLGGGVGGLLPAEACSGVEICSGCSDLLFSSSGELAPLPACRRSASSLAAAGWAGGRSCRCFPDC